MPAEYPILNDRPIDQWKVAELKEELKRRKLAIRGLKDDLIKRLDEAIRNERDSIEEEVAIHTEKDSNEEEEEEICVERIHTKKDSNEEEEEISVERDSAKGEAATCTETGFSVEEEAVENYLDCDLEPQVKCKDVETKSTEAQMVEDVRGHDENQAQEVDDYAAVVNIDGSPNKLGEGNGQDAELMGTTDSVELVGQPVDLAVSVETNITISETVIIQTTSSEQERQNVAQAENEDPKPLHEDAVLNVSDPNDQVSEVSPVLGFQVKSESISTDSVSINEKNELKDNLNADNFHLEVEVVKPEMVQPSSSDVPYKGGDIHPLDEQVPHENQSSVEEIDDTNATTYVDLNRKNDSADGGSKNLNLDPSLVVDSMDEDILKIKHTDSNHDFNELGDRKEVHAVEEESPDDIVGLGLSFDQNVSPTENKNILAVPAEKRKLDQEVAGNNEPSKRQRRWNSEALKVPERQTSKLTPLTTPKDTVQSATPKRDFTRSESTLSSGEAPKERVVPQSPKPPTNSLRIDRFLRPFTLKAVQVLLAKTGTVRSFWMDHIKTHCYVTYSSVEEAMETRNALYNLQWPANGGRLLMVEFVEPQEVKMRTEAPSQHPPAPVSTSPRTPLAPPPFQPQPSPRQQVLRQQLPPPPPLPPPPLLTDPPAVRERLPLPPPPPLAKKPDQPIVTLDDLFRKTRATPRIYYLPLSEEQVAVKLSQNGKISK